MIGTVDWDPSFTGTVSVKVQGADDCGPGPFSDGLDVTIFDCTGIREIESNKVFIYPNPVENELTLQCTIGETGNAQLRIFNSFGQQVIRKEINAGNGELITTLSTDGFATGAYSVKLISPSGKLFEGKFLKLK
jgi:ABC-type sugar transport system substrate-binding protein